MADTGERAALEVLYGGWEAYQRGLAAAIAGLTDDQLELRAATGLRTVGEQLRHIIGVRVGWIHGDLGAGGPEYDELFERYDPANPPDATPDELRRDLDRTWQLIREQLDGWTPADLTETVVSKIVEPGHDPEALVRGWVVYHVMEHDLHHGGELGFLLGMHGLPAPRI